MKAAEGATGTEHSGIVESGTWVENGRVREQQLPGRPPRDHAALEPPLLKDLAAGRPAGRDDLGQQDGRGRVGDNFGFDGYVRIGERHPRIRQVLEIRPTLRLEPRLDSRFV